MLRVADIELIDEDGRHHAPDPQLVSLAEKLISWFIELRPQYAPGAVTISKRSLKKFYQAAAICRERGQDPALYVRRQLEGMARRGCFYASAIANEDLARQTDEVDTNLLAVMRYKAQLELFRKRVSLYGPVLAIRDRANPFTPLVRCLLAKRYGLEDIIDEYRDEALVELETTPVAREAFGASAGFLNDNVATSGGSRD